MLSVISFTSSALLPPQLPIQQTMNRRAAVLHSAAAVVGFGVLQQEMLPPAFAISATTMSGKSKPDLGVILAEEPTEIVNGKGGRVSADVVLSSGLATVSFASPWSLAEGNYYDVATKNQNGDSAFLQVVSAGGKSLSSLDKKFFSKAVLSLEGFFGAYGEPIDAVIKEGTPSAANGVGARSFEIGFTPLTPSGDGSPRKGILTAIQPAGSKEIVMLIASTSATRWKKAKGESDARGAAESFSISMRETSLKMEAASDFRYGKASGPSGMKSRNDGF